ncbi:MAG: phosphoribosyltransferase family protein [Bacteroidia bacterium]|nr:phosphoribosyltransferase family protein [Bacteroidia bacterium]MDW8235159.1 phosphoribosyltransferase family protein [Bacteroidia bacterium]
MKEAFARFLWETGIVQVRVQPPWFVWSSGRQSPIYLDLRRLQAYPTWRRQIVEAAADLLRQRALLPAAIVGVATGGIPWAAWIAEALGLPSGYCRPRPKEHGLSRSVEGLLPQENAILLVEDVFSTGESLRKSISVARQEGFFVKAAFTLWNYDLASASPLPCPTYALFSFSTMLLLWRAANLLSEETYLLLRKWHSHNFSLT